MVETSVETAKEKEGTTTKEKEKRKKGNWFLHFLMYGGWILVLIVILGIIFAVFSLSSGG